MKSNKLGIWSLCIVLLLVSAVSVVGVDNVRDAIAQYDFDALLNGTILEDAEKHNNLTLFSGLPICGRPSIVNMSCDINGSVFKNGVNWNPTQYCIGVGIKTISGINDVLLLESGGYATIKATTNSHLGVAHYTGGAWSSTFTCDIPDRIGEWDYFVFSFDGNRVTIWNNGTVCSNRSIGVIDANMSLEVSKSVSSWYDEIDELSMYYQPCTQSDVNILTEHFLSGEQYPFSEPIVSLDILFLNSSGFVGGVAEDESFYVVLNLTSDGVAVNDSSCNVSLPGLGLKETSFNSSDDFYYSGALVYANPGDYSINASCSIGDPESRVLVVFDIVEPVTNVSGVSVDLSTLSDCLTNIFLLFFWAVLLVLALVLKGAKGQTIQFLNIMQMLVGFVAGSVWMHEYFLIGFPLIFVSLGFFLGLIMDK